MKGMIRKNILPFSIIFKKKGRKSMDFALKVSSKGSIYNAM